MKNEGKPLGYYNYTVVLTYIGMLVGLYGILSAFEQYTFRAVLCLMVSGLCDMFDGTIASTKKRTEPEKCFGIQIDSLSDLICFGVLPAAIVYSMGSRGIPTLLICGFYVLCALIRLAYFNVDEQERQKHSSGSRELYLGLPVTLSALFLPLIYGMNQMLSPRPGVPLSPCLLLMGLLFLTPFPLKKPHLTGKVCVLLCGVAEVLLLSLACLDV